MPFIQEVLAITQISNLQLENIPSVLDFLQAHEEDKECWKTAESVGFLDSRFIIDESGIDVQILYIDGVTKILVPRA